MRSFKLSFFSKDDLDRINKLKNKIERAFVDFLNNQTIQPSKVELPEDHILRMDDKTLRLEKRAASSFEEDIDYFEIWVNQLFLKDQSQLWVTTDPTVLTNTVFGYADKPDVSVPCLVGPETIQKEIQNAPVPSGGRMIIRNTRVAGFYPYKGGTLRYTIILCQANKDNYAKKIMKIVEGVAGAIDYTTQLSTYLKVAGVIIDGVEELKGLQAPLKGLCGIKDVFKKPGCIALINKPKMSGVNLWVVNDKLMKGLDAQHLDDFTEADFALFSITKSKTRNDYQFLPFYQTFKKIMEDACRPDDASWERAQKDMNSLFWTLVNSPDLTTSDAEALHKQWWEKIKKFHEMTKPKIETAPKLLQPPKGLTEEDMKFFNETSKITLDQKRKRLLQESLKPVKH